MSTFTTAISTCDGFKGFKCPMKPVERGWEPDFTNRYFTEDIPEGVCMYKGIADLAGVETPVMDEIVCFFQKFMGKEYIKDGKLAGKDVGETKSPQRYGITSLEDLLKDVESGDVEELAPAAAGAGGPEWEMQRSDGSWLAAPFKPPAQVAAGRKGQFTFGHMTGTVKF